MCSDQRWSALAVNTCVSHGIDHFFLAPGSRCTPLTLAVANHDNAKVTQHFDERGLAFAALGYARATRKPGVFVCTSGTAVANAFPAVIEASMECVPMLLFTADRPPELRGTGANQSIDQQRIFGDYPRWFFDMPCPTEGLEDGFVRSQVEHAIISSRTGPAHMNWMFREPFGTRPMPRSAFRSNVEVQIPALSQTTVDPIRCFGDVLVIAGGCRPEEATVAIQIAEKLNAPLLTDITSGLRGISPDVSAKFNLPSPDTVIHIGGRIVSKAWTKYTATLPLSSTKFWHFTPRDIRIDPNHLGLERIVAPLDDLLRNVSHHGNSSDSFRHAWEQSEESRRSAIRNVLESDSRLSEPSIAYAVGQHLQSDHALFLGNSTPIRSMDWFAQWNRDQVVPVGANRGASGIDGLIASAVGFAGGIDRPTTLILGDLSALHDLNSMALVARSEVPLIVLVVNNHGGGIFDMLPIATQSGHFEQFFATPHSIGFEKAAEMFGLNYTLVRESDEFTTEYLKAMQSGQSIVIEAITDRSYNQQVRKRIDAEIAK